MKIKYSKNCAVLLINPTVISEIPSNLGILGAIFKENGFQVFTSINTFSSHKNVSDFVCEAKKRNVQIVGISMMTFQVLKTYCLVRELKKEGMIVVLGGPHPSDCPEECLQNECDIVVRNEGEETLRELCLYWKGQDSMPLGEIQGISYLDKNNKIISTPDRNRINLDTVPRPDFDIFDRAQFLNPDGLVKGVNRIYTSRGCPGRCTFCDWQVFGQKIRYYNLETVIDDIQRRIDAFGVTSFNIADDCFTVNKRRVFEFCEHIQKRNLKILWQASSRATLVNPDLLKAMKDSGCFQISYGLESGDPETLRLTRKGVSLEQNILAPKMAAAAGLQVYANLMIGFPWETPESLDNNLKLIHEIWDDVYLFQISGTLVPFPGTEIYSTNANDYDFKNYWLKPEYQNFGIQTYQNMLNPLAHSTFYQRYLFDDTYIHEEAFFKYTTEYKKKTREIVHEVGRHNIETMFKSKPAQICIHTLCRLSQWTYDKYPSLEKRIGGWLYKSKNGDRSKVEKRRDTVRGFVKSDRNVITGTRRKRK
jgi:radical SAM superfamily enzyme YgiQ (UPF0313 family)